MKWFRKKQTSEVRMVFKLLASDNAGLQEFQKVLSEGWAVESVGATSHEIVYTLIKRLETNF